MYISEDAIICKFGVGALDEIASAGINFVGIEGPNAVFTRTATFDKGDIVVATYYMDTGMFDEGQDFYKVEDLMDEKPYEHNIKQPVLGF